MLLRVDGDRMVALMKERKVTALSLSETMEVNRKTVANFRDETYPLLSDAAAHLGVHPLALVKEVDGVLSVDGEKFRAYMTTRELDARSLAVLLGVHYNTVFNLMKFEFEKANRFAKLLDVSPLALLTIE